MSSLDYTLVLADLRSKRDELQQQIQTVDAAIAGVQVLIGTAIPAALPQQAPAGPFANMTMPAATEALLRTTRRVLSTAEIAERLISGGFKSEAANFSSTLGAVLSRHSKEVGRVVRMANGWGLAEWKQEAVNETAA